MATAKYLVLSSSPSPRHKFALSIDWKFRKIKSLRKAFSTPQSLSYLETNANLDYN